MRQWRVLQTRSIQAQDVGTVLDVEPPPIGDSSDKPRDNHRVSGMNRSAAGLSDALESAGL